MLSPESRLARVEQRLSDTAQRIEMLVPTIATVSTLTERVNHLADDLRELVQIVRQREEQSRQDAIDAHRWLIGQTIIILIGLLSAAAVIATGVLH